MAKKLHDTSPNTLYYFTLRGQKLACVVNVIAGVSYVLLRAGAAEPIWGLCEGQIAKRDILRTSEWARLSTCGRYEFTSFKTGHLFATRKMCKRR